MAAEALAAPPVRKALDRLLAERTVSRIWKKDPSVWRKQPERQAEIADRLGWLTAPEIAAGQVADLRAFADEVRSAGFKHAAVLGMGGSSLCPEVLRATFSNAPGFPEPIVLDSTVPSAVERVAATVDPARSLFVVSSKSGTTTEPSVFFKYFYSLVLERLGDRAGGSFVAVTDPGTPLEKLARERGFRRVFPAQPDVGGRYSAFTHFGMVPAALLGLDLNELVSRGVEMQRRCSPGGDAENPGAQLGAALGGWYGEGRDKLTFIASPAIRSFGLWAEQLIAESTGKEGRGILPIAGEQIGSLESYGDDRLFAYLRLDGDDNRVLDDRAAALEAGGHPVIRLGLRDRYDIGAEFYRWEFATAVAGALLGIHPFDQPNVQESKDNTVRVLKGFSATGGLPEVESGGTLGELIVTARPGDYVALMAYVEQTPETDAAFENLRRWLLDRRRLPSTLGYGPRFLHSTGQLHKGGKANGLFVQFVQPEAQGGPIPGEEYSFQVLVLAQAAGDLQALRGHGRKAIRVKLGADPAAEVRKLGGSI